eukprot:TRINITY_DN5788_c0_g1_i1.p1 TRINITY_DN5788_c0_g1~~TRINITY_DN5788_c0_g1_i1.p1  ORF type:complete len:425 (-),score=50.30 TRINITY_DN5788_c0_g1_i1:130-1299(-)
MDDQLYAPLVTKVQAVTAEIKDDKKKIQPKFIIPLTQITISDTTALGHGSFGVVLRATWKGTTVAAKKIQPPIESIEVYAPYLHREINILTTVGSHPNLLNLLGVSCEGDRIDDFTAYLKQGKEVYLITEFLERGDLKKYIDKKRIKQFPEKVNEFYLSMCEIFLNVTSGMRYLHEHLGIVHRDLKCENILLSNATRRITCEGRKSKIKIPEIKIGDFGLANDFQTNELLQSNVGTMGWRAPEVAGGKGYGKEADVYSFGVMIYELLAKGGIDRSILRDLTDYSIGEQSFIFKDQVENTVPQLWEICKVCCKQNPKERPTFEKLQTQFSQLKTQLFNLVDCKQLTTTLPPLVVGPQHGYIQLPFKEPVKGIYANLETTRPDAFGPGYAG